MYVKSHDGKFEMYHNTWKEKKELRGSIFIVHGLGEHCHRYDRIICFLTENGFRVHSFDHRGHGRTHNHLTAGKQGHCGHIDSEVEVIMKDISELIQKKEDDQMDVPKYLLGHSLGGLMAVYYAMTREMISKVSGLITIAPAIGIGRPPNIILRKLAPLAAKIIPTFTIESDIRLSEISRLPEVQKSLEDDKLMHRKISFGTGKVVLEMCAEIEESEVPEIKIPCLFIHGTSDKITDPIATESFYNKLKCPLKRLYLHEEGYHKPHDDLGSEIVFEEIEKFIKETCFK